ncbi:hypothetical protein BGZ96_011059 [Linnemannia gamsii]|uniref:Uncharacterized protein n=1 Tax=Linnemannia gamsii TaxID=64522 RepID=A0ABQ7JTE1_9FUNG|nr:hypothetical protein BGZ96_011059 [Linnemannia gamsii]
MCINNPAAAAAAPISIKEYPILWWTTWFWADEKEDRLIDTCGLPYNCRMTHIRAVYNEASTTVFHGSMFYENIKDLPPLEDAQNPKKAWVMNTEYIRMLDQDDEAYLRLLRYKSPGNVTVAQTLEHLSPSLRRYYDTGDSHSNWGVDGRGATCKMCKLTHDLAEGIFHLVPGGPAGSSIRTPITPAMAARSVLFQRNAVDWTCQEGKWNWLDWAYDFWSWLVANVFIVLIGFSLLAPPRLVRNTLVRTVGIVVGKVRKVADGRRNHSHYHYHKGDNESHPLFDN